MTKFEIRQVSPTEHTQQIRGFWQKYLPVTPMARLEWLEGNPAGATLWLFAYDGKTQEVAGMVSITKKEIYVEGKLVSVGILGDLMAGERYRVFGPAMQLIREGVAAARNAAISWVYTIPN